jgi:hypothetical protein
LQFGSANVINKVVTASLHWLSADH